MARLNNYLSGAGDITELDFTSIRPSYESWEPTLYDDLRPSSLSSMSNTTGPGSVASTASFKSDTFSILRPQEIDRICPFMSGQTQECVPERCGIDAPCLRFVDEIPEIEDCINLKRSHHDMTAEPSPSLSSYGFDWSARPSSQITADAMSSTQSDNPMSDSPPPPPHRSPPTIQTCQKSTRAPGRQSHSLVERRYRENLNAKIDELQDALQHTSFAMKSGPLQSSDPSVASPTKLRKGDVLVEALKYVHDTEVEMRHMASELKRLRSLHSNSKRPTGGQIETTDKCGDCSLRKQIISLKMLAE